jgi:hypothetical protein
MSNQSNATVATMGIVIGKNSFHAVGLDQRGAIVLGRKWSRGQVEARHSTARACRFRHFVDGSLALACFTRTCRNLVPTFPEPPSLDDSSLRRLEIST